MIDETTKFNRAKGYYNRIALAGNTDGAFKELVAFNKQADERIPFSEGLDVDRYNKIRPVVNRDYSRGATDADTYKIVFRQDSNYEKYRGTKFYKSKADAEKALKAKQKLISETRDAKKKPPKPAKADKFLVKVGPSKRVDNVMEQNFIEVIGSRGRPETYTKTGVEKTLYRAQISVNDKTVLSTDFGSKADAIEAVKIYRAKNPIKNAPPDLETMEAAKKKRYLDKRERSKKISERGGVETFETGDDKIHKGHAQNIDNPNVKIKPSNIIYTPQKINQAMSGSEGEASGRYTDLDYKIDVAENKIKDIKKSNLPESEKKKLLAEQDNKLMKYVADSDGYKTVTLSNNKPYGEIFQKTKSMDMFDEFSNMTEKETKKFVNQYFTNEGKLKDKWNIDASKISKADQEGIKKSYVFLENIKNAKTNAKQLELIKTLNKVSNKGGSKGKAAAQVLAMLTGSTVGAVADDGSEGTTGMLIDAGIGGGTVATLGTKTGRKILMNLLNASGLPASAAFNIIYGIDPSSSLDRSILGFELAISPTMVKDALRVTEKIKNPLLKKIAQTATTISPKYAMKAARIANPIGVTMMGGELTKKIIEDSNPNYYIGKDGEPTFYDRENASDVFPSMIDANEQAYRIAKEQNITYEEALRQINMNRLVNLKND